MVPFDSQDNRGIVYVWIGDKVNPEEARLAEEIADDMFGVGFLSFLIGRQAIRELLLKYAVGSTMDRLVAIIIINDFV